MSFKSATNAITVGVLPLPPKVAFPTQMTGTPTLRHAPRANLRRVCHFQIIDKGYNKAARPPGRVGEFCQNSGGCIGIIRIRQIFKQ